MSKEKTATYPLFRELLQFGIYKRNQGKITRQVTAAAIAVAAGLGAWRLSEYESSNTRFWQFGLPLILWLVVCWFAFRLVNLPTFADFLIAVEAEMNKVSWPTRSELFRSSMVVIISIVILTGSLFVFDVFWVWSLGRLLGTGG